MRFRANPARLAKTPQTNPDASEVFLVQTQKLIAWSVLIFLASVVVCASAQTESPVPIKNIIVGMAQAGEHNHAYFRPYVATVEYKLFGEQNDVPTSQVIAELTFVPPYLKSYAI
jgi:hypothetical protein